MLPLVRRTGRQPAILHGGYPGTRDIGTGAVLIADARGSAAGVQGASEPIEGFAGRTMITPAFSTGVPVDVIVQASNPVSGIRANRRYDSATQTFQG